MRFNGTFTNSVDEKGRAPLPFRWRPKKSVEFFLVIWDQHEAGICLRGLLPPQWEELMEKINVMDDANPRKRILLRRLVGGSTQLALDNAGRLALPENMRKAAGITDQAMWVGLRERFEIWNPEQYAKAAERDEPEFKEGMKLLL